MHCYKVLWDLACQGAPWVTDGVWSCEKDHHLSMFSRDEMQIIKWMPLVCPIFRDLVNTRFHRFRDMISNLRFYISSMFESTLPLHAFGTYQPLSKFVNLGVSCGFTWLYLRMDRGCPNSFKITVVCFAHLTCKMLFYHIGGLQAAIYYGISAIPCHTVHLEGSDLLISPSQFVRACNTSTAKTCGCFRK